MDVVEQLFFKCNVKGKQRFWGLFIGIVAPPKS